MTSETKDTARDQARAKLDSIVELINARNGGEVDGETLTADDVAERIQEDPLSVEVRTDWHSVGDSDNKPTEYMILLCTGGPACRIIGDLDIYATPTTARIEYQDWFTPWTRYGDTSTEEDDSLLTYASHFYFGE